MWLALAALGCQAEGRDCERKADCFAGEVCAQGSCQVEVEVEPPACSPQSCAGPLVAQTQCVEEQCEVVACVRGAARCETGCCEGQAAQPASWEDELSGEVATLTPSGHPSLWGWSLKRRVLTERAWDGLRWVQREHVLSPEALNTFDVRYSDDGALHVVYLSDSGQMYYAMRRADEEAFQVELISAALPQVTLPHVYVSVKMQLSQSSAGSIVHVSLIYGTREQLIGAATTRGYPKAWYIERPVGGGWVAPFALTQEDESALLAVSHAHHPGNLYNGLIAALIKREGDAQARLKVWTRQSNNPWQVNASVGALTQGQEGVAIERDGAIANERGDFHVLYTARIDGQRSLRELRFMFDGSATSHELMTLPSQEQQLFTMMRYAASAEGVQRYSVRYDFDTARGEGLVWPDLERGAPLTFALPDQQTLWWGLPKQGGAHIFYKKPMSYDYLTLASP